MILLHLLKSKYRVSAADLICRIEEMQQAVPISTPTKRIQEKEIPVIEKIETVLPPQKKDQWVEQDLLSPPIAPAPPPMMPMEPTPSQKQPISSNNQAKYDTLMRFASVELEGLLTKES